MKKLYDQLIEDGEYTGSFEEFKAQYGDAKKSKVLFDGFTEEGKYTGSFEEFNAQYEFPSAKKEGPADVDPVVAPSNDTGSNLVDGSSEFQDLKPFSIDGREVSEQEFKDYARDTAERETYGKYLKEDGSTGYNEKPYSVQLQDYKSGFEGILKAEGPYSFLKDYDIEYRQNFAETQLANKAPRYTRQQYNRSTDSYDSVPTEDGAKAFAKNLPKDFDSFDDKKDFNIALEQGIQKTIAEDPLINYQIKIANKKAELELKDYALDLREKYDFETPEGIELAKKDYNNRWKELVIDPVANSKAYKNTIKDLQLVAADVSEEQNISFGRYKDSFLSSIDFIDKNDPTGLFGGLATNIIEPFVGVVAGGMKSSFNNAQAAAQQVSLEKDYSAIVRLKNDLESGRIKEDSKATYGGRYSNKEGYTTGGVKGTVKEKIKYLEGELKTKNESIAVDIAESMEASESDLAIY